MKIVLKPLLLAAALAFGAAGHASAQTPPHHPAPDQAAPPSGHAAMPGMTRPGMDMSRMDMGAKHCQGLSDARLADARDQIGIDPRQIRAWNAFAAAQRADPMPGGMRMDMSAGMDRSQPGGMAMQPGAMPMMHGPLPERLARDRKSVV